jgi:hypothetical protein
MFRVRRRLGFVQAAWKVGVTQVGDEVSWSELLEFLAMSEEGDSMQWLDFGSMLTVSDADTGFYLVLCNGRFEKLAVQIVRCELYFY